MKKMPNEKGQESCLIQIDYKNDSRDQRSTDQKRSILGPNAPVWIFVGDSKRDILLDLRKELETPFEAISYRFLIILAVAALILLYSVFKLKNEISI